MGKRLERGAKNKMAVMKRKGKWKLMNVEEEGRTEKTCRCNVKDDEECICYFYNERRMKELEEKMGKEKFLKKQLVDELTQILIEYDCP